MSYSELSYLAAHYSYQIIKKKKISRLDVKCKNVNFLIFQANQTPNTRKTNKQFFP